MSPSPTLGQVVTGGVAGATGARGLEKPDAPPRTPDFGGLTGKPEPMRMMQDGRLPLPKHKVNRFAVKPSSTPDELRKPLGTPEKPPANPKSEKEMDFSRSILRQNEAAQLLAKAGYVVEQQPKLTQRDIAGNPWFNQTKKPDFKIEEQIFDCYAPKSDTDARNIVSNIVKKIEDGQTRRIVLNMQDSRISLDAIKDELKNTHLPELEEIIIIKDGKVIPWLPFEKPTPISSNTVR
jgi:hypothetical protein